MDMSLSKLWEIVKGREAWSTVVHGVENSEMTERLNNRLRACVSWVLIEGKGKLRFHVSHVF